MEAEYISLSMCMRDLIPLRRVLQDLCEVFDLGEAGLSAHSTVFEDNSAALTLANFPQMTPQSKHIALRYHFFRSEVASGNIKRWSPSVLPSKLPTCLPRELLSRRSNI